MCLSQLQQACQNYSTHSLLRDNSVKTGKDSYSIQLIGTNKVKQNGETEKYSPNEGTRKNLRKNHNQMEISKLPDKDSQTVIKMFNKLESTKEALKEHFNTDIENVINNQG